MLERTDLSDLDYKLMLDDIRTNLGEESVDICDMLSHGYGKRQVAKQLNKPYSEVRDSILKIKKFLEEYYGKDKS